MDLFLIPGYYLKMEEAFDAFPEDVRSIKKFDLFTD